MTVQKPQDVSITVDNTDDTILPALIDGGTPFEDWVLDGGKP